jgi:polyhydroxybutyrate depolymerase
MKKLLILAVLLLVAQDLYAQQTISDSLISDGVMRYYHVYIPKNYIKGSSRPLIIHLHGYGLNGTLEQFYTNYMPVADTAGFLVAYPEGLVDNTGRQYWNAGIPGLPTTHDDVAFLSNLIDALHNRFTIDKSRVYASGLSNGGYMCYRLAWQLSDKIAAIASVSGSMSHHDFLNCTPPRPIPVMEIHGTADQTVPYTSSAIGTDIDSLLHFWVLNDHCLPISDPINLPDKDPADGSTVMHFQWSAELLNTSCELYRIIGGAHLDWPGAGAGNNMDFSASPTIWQFFNRYQTSQSSVKERPESTSIGFYPNPCSAVIHISIDIPGKITIVDITGRKVIVSQEKEIDVSSLVPGMYQLCFEADGILHTEKLIKF